MPANPPWFVNRGSGSSWVLRAAADYRPRPLCVSNGVKRVEIAAEKRQ